MVSSNRGKIVKIECEGLKKYKYNIYWQFPVAIDLMKCYRCLFNLVLYLKFSMKRYEHDKKL